MFTVTDSARAHLARMLSDARAPEGAALRLVARGKRVDYKLDRPILSDELIEHEGRPVLLLDGRAWQMLAEKTLDVAQTADGPSLTLL